MDKDGRVGGDTAEEGISCLGVGKGGEKIHKAGQPRKGSKNHPFSY